MFNSIRVKFLKSFSLVLAIALGSLGFSACYGTLPNEFQPLTFKLSGQIKSSETKMGIKGIEVGLTGSDENNYISEISTDENGFYNLSLTDNIAGIQFKLKIKDVDGEANGSFNDKEVTVDFSDSTFTEGVGLKTLDVDIEPKS